MNAVQPDAADGIEVVVVATRGSAPREPGARLHVGPAHCEGTIGGGRLEWEAIATARAMLARGDARRQRRRFALGPALGQCCGGEVELVFLPAPRIAAVGPGQVRCRPLDDPAGDFGLPPGDDADRRPARRADGAPVAATTLARVRAAVDAMRSARSGTRLLAGEPALLVDVGLMPARTLLLYGAGHVGDAIARVVAPLGCALHWIDDRLERPDLPPAREAGWQDVDPLQAAANAPADACHVVVTHSHALDYAIVARLLARHDAPRFVGLIGSATKRALFERRLRAAGIGADRIAALACPVGIAGIVDKTPAAIAIAVAAQLLQVWSRAGVVVPPDRTETAPAPADAPLPAEPLHR